MSSLWGIGVVRVWSFDFVRQLSHSYRFYSYLFAMGIYLDNIIVNNVQF